MREVREILRFWEARRGQPLALATLVAAQGSSYRRPGARMVVDSAGAAVGGVSAGCIEEEVIACAQEVLHAGVPQLMTFDTRLRFGCHGTIQILVEVVAHEMMTELSDRLAQRQSCRLETAAHGDARGTRIAAFEADEGSFVQTIEPVLRLILVGDSADTVALHAQAALLGWEVWHVDAAPDVIDDRTAVVVATHNFGRDCAALRDLLPTALRYVGLVGSRRRRDDILFDVMGSGITTRAGLFAPAGLHIGADSPEEIALSIVTEIQCVFGGGTAEPLRHRRAPIHQPGPELLPCTASAA